jgi:DHA2 family methylenomycin A resistance protein-like MFS transporter
LLVTGGLTFLIMGLIESSSQGWTSPLILGLFIGSAVCLSAFLLVEARGREPLLPLRLFTNGMFSVANITALMVGLAVIGCVFFMAQYLQDVQGYTALESGLRILPLSIGTFLVAPFAGRIAGRIGPRLPIVLGALLSGIALILLMRLSPDSNYATIWWNLALVGIGLGLVLSPLTVAVLSATPPNRAGLGSSIINTSRQVGITLGTAVLGTYVLQQFSGNIASQLTQRGVSGPTSATIANKIAAAGANAGQAPLPGHLSLSPTALHQAIGQAFVDAIHGSFLISGIALLAAALLVAFFLQQKQPRTMRTSVESVDAQVITEVGSMQPIPVPSLAGVGGTTTDGDTDHL